MTERLTEERIHEFIAGDNYCARSNYDVNAIHRMADEIRLLWADIEALNSRVGTDTKLLYTGPILIRHLSDLWSQDRFNDCRADVGHREAIILRDIADKIDQQCGWKSPLTPSGKSVADLLVNVAQILDVVKSEWKESWSEWDQSVRDELSRILKEVMPIEAGKGTGLSQTSAVEGDASSKNTPEVPCGGSSMSIEDMEKLRVSQEKKSYAITAEQFHRNSKPWPDNVVEVTYGRYGFVYDWRHITEIYDGWWIVLDSEGKRYACSPEDFVGIYNPKGPWLSPDQAKNTLEWATTNAQGKEDPSGSYVTRLPCLAGHPRACWQENRRKHDYGAQWIKGKGIEPDRRRPDRRKVEKRQGNESPGSFSDGPGYWLEHQSDWTKPDHRKQDRRGRGFCRACREIQESILAEREECACLVEGWRKVYSVHGIDLNQELAAAIRSRK